MHLRCCSTFGKLKNTRLAARVFVRFPKVSQRLAGMDHAILHGKPFGIPLSHDTLIFMCQNCKNSKESQNASPKNFAKYTYFCENRTPSCAYPYESSSWPGFLI